MDIRKEKIDKLISLYLDKKEEKVSIEIYRRYANMMFNSAFKIIQNRDDAQDVMQQSFILSFSKLAQYQGGNQFGGWLKKITIRNCIKFLNEKAKRKLVSINDKEYEQKVSEDNLISEGEQSKQVWQAINQLNPRYRQAIVLMYYEGYDYEEIATLMKISPGSCRTLISRAKESIRKIISHE